MDGRKAVAMDAEDLSHQVDFLKRAGYNPGDPELYSKHATQVEETYRYVRAYDWERKGMMIGWHKEALRENHQWELDRYIGAS